MVIREREVEDGDGRRYLATVRPYKSVSNRIDGAVLALFDVSDSLKVARETGEALMATFEEPIVMLDSNLTVRRANQAFYTAFRVSPNQTEGRLLFDVDNGQWNIAPLRRLLEEVVPQRRNFEAFPLEHDFPTIGFKRLVVDVRRITSGRGDGIVLLIIREQAS